jgi:MFS family permease
MPLFVLVSAACGLAPDARMLVGARFARGVGAAMISANVLSMLGVLYTGPRRVRAITVYGMVMGAAAVGGQLIGGLLIHADVAGSGWRPVLWLRHSRRKVRTTRTSRTMWSRSRLGGWRAVIGLEACSTSTSGQPERGD